MKRLRLFLLTILCGKEVADMAENLTHLLATSLGFGALIALLLFLRRRLSSSRRSRKS